MILLINYDFVKYGIVLCFYNCCLLKKNIYDLKEDIFLKKSDVFVFCEIRIFKFDM